MLNRKVQYENESKNRILNIFLRIIFGFIIPFVVINGLIYFVYTASPNIIVLEEESQNTDNNTRHIYFNVDCPIPLSNVVVFYIADNDEADQVEIPYTKLGNRYDIEASQNGTYYIVASALNKSLARTYFPIDTLDNTPPRIDIESVILQAKSITLTILDEQSGINYDNLYALDESGRKETPQFLDESSGTVSFRFENTTSLTIHIEDKSGNMFETTFEKND